MLHEDPKFPDRAPLPAFPEQDENGVDLSLIIENLRLTPTERVRRGDQARRDALRVLEYGRKHREKRP